MSAELAQAEQVMLEHEKENFNVEKITKHHHHKEKNTEGGPAKYSSLVSSFDQLKPNEELPPGLHKVLHKKHEINVLQM